MIQVIATKDAPKAIGPYSQALVHNGIVYVSGQIPFIPETGELVKGSITEQTNQVLKNISAILKEAGTELNNVIKTTVYLKDMNDFDEMNKAYGRAFLEQQARSRHGAGCQTAERR